MSTKLTVLRLGSDVNGTVRSDDKESAVGSLLRLDRPIWEVRACRPTVMEQEFKLAEEW